MTDTIEKIRVEKLTEPARRWRNLFIVITEFKCVDTGQSFDIGDEYWGRHAWPSKDVAEQMAQKGHDDNMRQFGYDGSVHVGAFPVTQ